MQNNPAYPWDCARLELTGELYTVAVVGELVRASAWFECTPLTDDRWVILVKSEDAPALKRKLKAVVGEAFARFSTALFKTPVK